MAEIGLRQAMNGLIIQAAREAAQVSEEQCAAWLDVEPETLAAWEAGADDIPLSAFLTLTERLAIPIAEFTEEPHESASPNYVEAIADRLKTARLARRISAEEAGSIIGRTAEEWLALEQGAADPGIAMLATVASHLGYPLSQLIQRNGDNAFAPGLEHLPPEVAAWVKDPANAETLAAVHQLAQVPTQALAGLSRLLVGLQTRKDPDDNG